MDLNNLLRGYRIQGYTREREKKVHAKPSENLIAHLFIV